MSAPKPSGIRMKRRPKEQLQHPADLSEDEDVQLLSPVVKPAPKQQSSRPARKPKQPLKSQLPARMAEAIRREAELAKAHYGEVDRYELQEELASPEPLRHQGLRNSLSVTAQEDTENVPPPDASVDLPEIHSARHCWFDTQHIGPLPQSSPVATPSDPSVPVPQRRKDSVMNTTASTSPVADTSSTSPLQVVGAAPAQAASTPAQQHGSADHAAPQPSTGYGRYFRRDSIWSCESEAQLTTSASAADPDPPRTGGDIIKVTQSRSKSPAASAGQSNATVSAKQSVDRSSVTNSEADLFRSATDLSISTPSEVFITPSGGTKATPPGAAIPPVEPSVGAESESTPALIGALADAENPGCQVGSQVSACIDRDMLARVQGSCSTLHTPIPFDALLKSGGSKKGSQATPVARSTPLAGAQSTGAGAASQPSGATSPSTAQPSARLQQISPLSLPSQPVRSVARTPTSQNRSTSSSAAAAACMLHAERHTPLHATPEHQAHQQNVAEPVSADDSALVPPPSSLGGTPAASVRTSAHAPASLHSHDAPEASTETSCDAHSESAHTHSQPSGSRTRSTAPRTRGASAKLCSSVTSLPDSSQLTSAHTQPHSSGMQSNGGVEVASAAVATGLLQGTVGPDLSVHRRSPVDAALDTGTNAKVSLCTPPNIHAVAPSVSASSSAAKASSIAPGEPASASAHSMVQSAASEGVAAVAGSGCVDDPGSPAQAADSSANDAPQAASSKRNTASSRGTAAMDPRTGPTPLQSAGLSAESSDGGYTSQGASSIRDPSYTPELGGVDAAVPVPHTRVATRASMRVAGNRTPAAIKAASANSSGCISGPDSSAMSGDEVSHATPQRAGSVDPVASESTGYGPPPSSAARSTAAMRTSKQLAGNAAPLASESTDEGPPAAAEQGPAGDRHGVSVGTPISSAGQPAACPSTCATQDFSQLCSQTHSESQWTLTADSDAASDGGHSRAVRHAEQPDLTSMPQRRMSLAFSGRAARAAPNAAASLGAAPGAHHGTGAPPAEAAPDAVTAAASRDSIAASSVTQSGPSSSDVKARASLARWVLRNSLAASAAPSVSAAPLPSSGNLNSTPVQATATSAAIATPATTAAGSASQHPVDAPESSQNLSQVTSSTPASQPDTGARKAETPIPSRRDQKRLKARASMMLTIVPSQNRTQGAGPGAGSGPAVTPQHRLSTAPHLSSGTGRSGSAHPSLQFQNALLRTLPQQGDRRVSVGQQGIAEMAAAGAAPQTPPSLPGPAEVGRATGGRRDSVARFASRVSIMPDPSPIREESDTEHGGAVGSPESSVVEVYPDGTPVQQTPVPSAAVGRTSGARKTAYTSQAAGVAAAVAAPEAASMQPFSTPLSSARQRTDAGALQVPSALLSEAQGTAAVQEQDNVSRMSETSEDTFVRADVATELQADDGASEPLSATAELLMLCNQTEPLDFKTEVANITGGKKIVKKLAEGTFKEVYECGNDVVSVMPVDGNEPINGERPMSAEKVIPEVASLCQLAPIQSPMPALKDPEGRTSCCAAFPNMKKVVVVRGKYPRSLLAGWRQFAKEWADDEEKCQNENPGKLPASQLYTIMVVENGGSDLESYHVEDFRAAKSIILQVTLALAVAESCLQFEHRDLHWGNLLIKNTPDSASQVYRLRGEDWNVHSQGIKVCLIDFSLSRLIGTDGKCKCADLAKEDMSWLFSQFDEVRNPQTEAYYAMKQQAEKSWRQAGLEHQEGWHTFTPCTNVQWIAYLAKVLRYKKYPKAKGSKETYKGVSMTREEKSSLDAFMKELEPEANSEWAASCEKLVHHPFFADMLES